MILIFVHNGNQSYLDNVFEMTRLFNPTLRIILLGDESNKLIALKHNVEHYSYSLYYETIPYEHFSPNPKEYELFCFERWFILRNFMKEQKIDKIVYSDSDNAFCVNIELFHYVNARIGNKGNPVVPNVFFIEFDYLNKICDFYFILHESNFKEKIIPYSGEYNGIFLYSDMYFLNQAIEELKLEFETFLEHNNDIIFNGNFNNYKIEINDHKVYKQGTNCQLANIHFSYNAKSKTIGILKELM
jgi:hypothetical protein